ncbi:hypothetical protein E6C55_32145, partial [Cohnella fermenti]
MKLKEESIKWAINHLQVEKDTDLFPSPKEIIIFNDLRDKVVEKLKNYDITQHHFSPSSVTANLTCPAIDDDSCPRFNGNSDREPYANGKAEFGFPVHFR